MRTPDNYDLYRMHEAEQERELEKLPKCSCCGERIMDDFMYCIDGEPFCEECVKDNFRISVEKFMEE